MHSIMGSVVHLLDLSPLLALRMLVARGIAAEVQRLEAGGAALGSIATPS